MYTYFEITHFDGAIGQHVTQAYRWSWQTCPYQGDQYVCIEANAGTDTLPDWTHEEGVDNRRQLSSWIKRQAREAAKELAQWQKEQAELAEQARLDVAEFMAG